MFSTASDEENERMGIALEALHSEYVATFEVKARARRFEVVLYRDQAQFKANNRSRPWAEAYYLRPRSYAYASREASSHHWMVHEATHQLLSELSGYRPATWINEGLATYFGASQLRDGVLLSGVVDPNTYPIWWLTSIDVSGDLAKDIDSGKVIPLRQLLTNTGPDINQHVNRYYIHYWSLTHFLFHHDNGRYAPKFKELIALGGSVEDFESLIGSPEALQPAWYAHLRQYASSVKPVTSR